MLAQTAIRLYAPGLGPPSHAASVMHRADAIDECGKAGSLEQTMRLMGAVISYPRNTEIFGEDEPADYVYKVVRGGIRTYKILADGRRQIGAFYLRGDIFGLPFGDTHALSAEAMIDAEVLVVKRSTLNGLAGRDVSIAQELFALTSRQLQWMQRRIMLLAKSAQERVATFLMEMAERSSDNIVELPMSRLDIADYLGLTIETVSRTLTCLQSAALIDLPTSRRIVLRNRSALNAMNG
jgi:CRP/FNR family transcriptional regulator, nitrogen fixation regulation protein